MVSNIYFDSVIKPNNKWKIILETFQFYWKLIPARNTTENIIFVLFEACAFLLLSKNIYQFMAESKKLNHDFVPRILGGEANH